MTTDRETTVLPEGILGPPEPQRPNAPGKIDGIVGVDPFTLQCRDCGSTLTKPEKRTIAVFIITAGWNFHICEGRTGVRRCRGCLADVKAACGGRCNR